MSFFSAVTETATIFRTVGTVTTTPEYSIPTATVSQPSSAPAAPPSDEGVAKWLRADEARAYTGRWVLLDKEFRVMDSDNSPSDLLDRHPDQSAPKVVYVDDANASLAL